MPKPIHPLCQQLKAIAPSVVFQVKHTKDPNCIWDGDKSFDPDEEGFEAYDVDVKANAIVAGEFVTGTASLGGTWEKPDEIDPYIGGYLPQMLQEAAEELLENETLPKELRGQLENAVKFLCEHMKHRHAKQEQAASKRQAVQEA